MLQTESRSESSSPGLEYPLSFLNTDTYTLQRNRLTVKQKIGGLRFIQRDWFDHINGAVKNFVKFHDDVMSNFGDISMKVSPQRFWSHCNFVIAKCKECQLASALEAYQ